MSLALQLLLGGVLFLVVQRLIGDQGVIVLAGVLLALELWHDLRLYRNRRGDRDHLIAYRRWHQWSR